MCERKTVEHSSFRAPPQNNRKNQSTCVSLSLYKRATNEKKYNVFPRSTKKEYGAFFTLSESPQRVSDRVGRRHAIQHAHQGGQPRLKVGVAGPRHRKRMRKVAQVDAGARVAR